MTGARLSECLGLIWDDVDLADLDAAEVSIKFQLGRKSRQREPLKTAESRRVVDIPRSLALVLVKHKLAASSTQPADYVFVTRRGTPLGQRNVVRELHRAMTKAGLVKGDRPNFHAFRHTAASTAIAEGDALAEVSAMLGHRNIMTTATIYAHEIRDAERRAKRRQRSEDRYGGLLGSVSVATARSNGSAAAAQPAQEAALVLGFPQNGDSR